MTLACRVGVARFCAAIAISSFALPVAAQPRDDDGVGVSLTIDSCIDAKSELVQSLFLLELGTSDSPARQAEAEAETKVEVGCDGELIVIEVHDPVTGKSLVRRIGAGERSGRERLLALAVVELLVASWIELEATPDPVVTPADTVADKGTQDSAREIVRGRLPSPAPWQTTLSVHGTASWNDAVLGGAGIGVARHSPRGFGWSADVTLQAGEDDVTLGAVSISSIGISGAVHLRREVGPTHLSVATGARFSAVTMTGEPEGGDVLGGRVSGVAGGPLVRVAGEMRAGSFTAILSIESGYNALEMRGLVDGEGETSIDGIWLGSVLAAGWSW